MKLDIHRFDWLVGLLEMAINSRELINRESKFQYTPWTLEVNENDQSAVDIGEREGLRVHYRYHEGEWHTYKPSQHDAIGKLIALRTELESTDPSEWIPEGEVEKLLGMEPGELSKSRGDSVE